MLPDHAAVTALILLLAREYREQLNQALEVTETPIDAIDEAMLTVAEREAIKTLTTKKAGIAAGLRIANQAIIELENALPKVEPKEIS